MNDKLWLIKLYKEGTAMIEFTENININKELSYADFAQLFIPALANIKC